MLLLRFSLKILSLFLLSFHEFPIYFPTTDWLHLTGLIHDAGKVMALWGEPQWAVVGDTFPVGCRFQEECVFHRFFEMNPDYNNSNYK